MGNLEILHDVLLAGSDFASCSKQVNRFFDRTMLIRYDEVLVLENESINGTEKEFWPRLQEGLAANQRVIGELLENLKGEGFATLEDLQGLEKGYVSKIFHTIAHLLDGFIGIDSRFYNLEEDSHGISRDLQQKILSAPQSYWVLRVKGRIASAGEEPFHALRTFEWKGKSND
ncbi:hypothetical protein ACFLZQ_06360 [Thermodesulfobacteriota bacterium]